MSAAILTQPVGPGDHVAGPEDAVVTLVEYGDYACPYCRLARPIVAMARRELGETLRFVFRHFPMARIHPHARLAAQAAEAAAAQGRFWEMHELLLENQNGLEEEHLVAYAVTLGLDSDRFARELRAGTYERRVSDDFQGGVRSGVNGTPSFFINGERYDGSWTSGTAFLRALRRSAGVPVQATSPK